MDTMKSRFLMGNEAVALGALHAKAALGTGYPGTPSSEILDVFNFLGGKAQWAPNEKVAAEVALGVAFGSMGSFVTMKHVGLNVAADVLFTAAYSGVDGALVFVVADDPGLASSQNEQDTRLYAKASGVPLLEPSDSQEAYDFMRLSFYISRKWNIPVILRLTTRVCHSGSIVVPSSIDEFEPTPHFNKDIATHVMVPANAKPAHFRLRKKLEEIALWNNEQGPNKIIDGEDSSMAFITSSISYMHIREAAPKSSVFKIGLSHPLPMEAILNFMAKHKQCMVIEENEPYLYEAISSAGGKLIKPPTSYRFGELTVSRVKNMIACKEEEAEVAPKGIPPKLCLGCPHLYTFEVLKELDCIVSGDIGCYTLAAMQPLSALHSQICMGASIGVGLGLRHVLPKNEAKKVVSVIGDSTFIHSGLTGLAEMSYNVPTTGHVLLILDNSTTAMTGQQEHPGTGKRLDKTPTNQLDYVKIAEAMNIKNVFTFDPRENKELFKKRLESALEKEELSVFIIKRPCILAMVKGAK